MSINTTEKENLVTINTLFSYQDESVKDRIKIGLAHTFIDIVSLDAEGLPVTPSAGTYSVYVKTTEMGGFKSVTDNGTINANLTGGSTLGDGVEIGASFSGNPLEIKVVPDSIVGAVSYKVSINQNLT